MKETSLTTEATKSTTDDPERATESVDDTPATESESADGKEVE